MIIQPPHNTYTTHICEGNTHNLYLEYLASNTVINIKKHYIILNLFWYPHFSENFEIDLF